MKDKWVLICVALFVVAGCASLKTAKSDIQTGYTTPLAQGEVSPQVQAQQVGQTVSAAVTTALPVTAPFAMPINAVVAGIAGIFFAWQRGRSIRKNQPVSANPVTGFLGNQTGLEGLIQGVATVSTGVTEFFQTGSSAQHAWQGILTGLAGVAGTALAVPQVGAIVASHPEIYAWVGGIAGFVNAIQQALTQVKPVATVATPAVTTTVSA